MTGPADSYKFTDGVLYIHGDVTVSNTGTTSQRIIADGDCTVTLSGVNISASGGPAILIESPHNVNLILADGTVNTVTGADNYAGIEVEFEFEEGEHPSNIMASLTISGNGTLDANGKGDGAGIGGSRHSTGTKGRGLFGNITINGGTINAKAPGGGAAIGSSTNPEAGTSSGSFKNTGYNVWGTITINDGTITATAEGAGAGIGGGNHVDSSKVIINSGTVTATGAAGIGCGIGSSKASGSDKGPGSYAADVTINGGTITAGSNDIGAAIGGGMYCDAVITITGGTINATGGSREGKSHHGGAGIGGGYLGHAQITISGGEISAIGGDGAAGIGSGGSPNATDGRGTGGRVGEVTVEYTDITISGGTIEANGGPKGGAGIGLGVGGDKVSVTITGGEITAAGALSNETDKAGGAGIGSGRYKDPSGSSKYYDDADVDITITGGDVTAIGGWGAAGIGSGAENKMADSITIETENTNLEAYADGTKFAIDTRILNDDGTTTSQTEGRSVDGNILQGTFVHAYEAEGISQDPEGLSPIIVTNDATGEQKTLTQMPESYRSYATNVSEAGTYTIYTDSEEIGEGGGRYFSTCAYDDCAGETDTENFVQYTVTSDQISDNFYLFPVKTIRITKEIEGEEEVVSGLNVTFHYALQKKGDDQFLEKDGEIWLKEIAVEAGVPQNSAFFVNIEDADYDAWEVDENGEKMTTPLEMRGATLVSISTRHGEGSDNNGSISPEQWNDEVTVINTFENDDPDPTPTPPGPPFIPFTDILPRTGISGNGIPASRQRVRYEQAGMVLVIPALELEAEIVSVPSEKGEYPVDGLGSFAGLPEGCPLPGAGRSLLTGHNHLDTDTMGPFAAIGTLREGDRILIRNSRNELMIFSVYANEKISETDLAGLERIASAEEDSLTLITCEDERAGGGYANRRIVAARPEN